MKRYFFFFLFIGSFSVLFGQDRTECWTKLSANKTLSAKWSVGLDMQYRTQSDYLSPENQHLFQYELTHSIRAWVFYKLPQKWTVIASPIAYFSATDIKSEGKKVETHELRANFGVSKDFKLGVLQNKNRFLTEVRRLQFDEPNAVMQYRYRLQNSLSLPIKKWKEKQSVNLAAANEFFIKTQTLKTGFDQNRTALLLQYQSHFFELTSGYLHIFQQGSSKIFQRRIWLTTLSVSFP